MKQQKMIDRNNECKMKKEPYKSPTIERLGEVKDLTRGASGMVFDNGSQQSGPPSDAV